MVLRRVELPSVLGLLLLLLLKSVLLQLAGIIWRLLAIDLTLRNLGLLGDLPLAALLSNTLYLTMLEVSLVILGPAVIVTSASGLSHHSTIRDRYLREETLTIC
jgi:hypothetical protein